LFGGEGFGKKEGVSGRNREHWKGMALGGLIFLHNTKPSSFGGTKKLYWRRVYMNSSNLIYVVIIFLKIYES